MIKSGAKFCKVQKSYYTDNHDAEYIKKYRNEFYIPAMEYHSRRAAVWTMVPLSEASPESLLDVCSTLKVSSVSDLPAFCFGSFNGVEHIKVCNTLLLILILLSSYQSLLIINTSFIL